MLHIPPLLDTSLKVAREVKSLLGSVSQIDAYSFLQREHPCFPILPLRTSRAHGQLSYVWEVFGFWNLLPILHDLIKRKKCNSCLCMMPCSPPPHPRCVVLSSSSFARYFLLGFEIFLSSPELFSQPFCRALSPCSLWSVSIAVNSPIIPWLNYIYENKDWWSSSVFQLAIYCMIQTNHML